MNYAIVLAGGKGTRMKTELPKCAYPLLNKPMISYVVDCLEKSDVSEIVVVVGNKKEIIQDILKDRVKYAVQEVQLGTAHACLMAKSLLGDKDGHTIIVPGDLPLISDDVIKQAMKRHLERRHDLTIVTAKLDNPFGYGRIIKNEENLIEGIVEEADASVIEQEIKEVNTGVYIVSNKFLFKALEKVDNHNKKNEYYLTDIVKILKAEGSVIGSYVNKDSASAIGVNDLYNLSIVESKLRLAINKKHMLNGVAMINPETITIGEEVEIEGNVTIHPNTYITGKSKIKKGAVVGPNTEIHNSIIGENVWCRHALVYDSSVDKNTTVGPFAHLREGTKIGSNNRIGNFVEVKNSSTGDNVKASHLAYIGDTTCGSNVNFGCGSITVNYDGKEKHKTIIGNDVFIGCNVNMIAPIEIKDNSFIAAGSTLNRNVPEGSLAIARAHQINKEDYARKLLKKPKKEEDK